MQVVLYQNRRFQNIWQLRDADTMEMVDYARDSMVKNGAFAADTMVASAVQKGYAIVGVNPATENHSGLDSNQDAAEGALYRAAHGAWDK